MVFVSEYCNIVATLQNFQARKIDLLLSVDATPRYCNDPQVWDAVAGEELHTFSHSHIVKTVDYSPSSTELLTGSHEKLLKIFDLNKPEAGKHGVLYKYLPACSL